jgi:hypothetical protein
MFLSSSVAVGMIGFSNSFKHNKVQYAIKIGVLCIIMLSIFIGFTTANDFNYYINNVETPLPDYIPLDSWKSWAYITYLYIAFLIVIAILYFARQLI